MFEDVNINRHFYLYHNRELIIIKKIQFFFIVHIIICIMDNYFLSIPILKNIINEINVSILSILFYHFIQINILNNNHLIYQYNHNFF